MNILGLEIRRRAGPGAKIKSDIDPPKPPKVSTPRASIGSIVARKLASLMPRWMRGDYTLRNSELIFSAVSRIANALSAMPIQLFRGSTPQRDDLNDLVSFAPNTNMTSTQFFKTLEACRCTYGNAYAVKLFDASGALSRLDILDPTRVVPMLEQDSGELWYVITPERGQRYYLHNYYVIHLPFISTNGYSGVNPISVLHNTLDYTDKVQKFSLGQIEKGVNAQVVLSAPANLGKDQKEEMLKDFTETYYESGGNILLLESGVTAHSLNLSPVDTKLFEVEKVARSRVAMVYNIPPHLLGDYSDVSFASQEQQMLEFLTLTMLPIVTAYEQELNRKLLTREQRRQGLHFSFRLESVLRADTATRADMYSKAIRGGWLSPNEVRAEFGLGSVKGGNMLLVARDLTTHSYLIEHPDKAESSSQNNNSKEDN
jgi:HK97 family phage portal protein